MTRDLSRLFNPDTIAVIGGGNWCRNVISQLQKIGYQGAIWPVHPSAPEILGLRCFQSLHDLPSPPEASFVGVNRNATVGIVRDLATMGAGGAVCFASGFFEAAAENFDGADLQAQLLCAAQDMPILGPNCYGFINMLDQVMLWPDLHGAQPLDSGVAIITQSSNIAINLTLQTRALPLAFMVTVGNQAQIGFADIGIALLQDPRITALGLHIEGFADLRAFERLAQTAAALNKPIIALKVGASHQAQAATISHTASLAGQDAGAQALLDRFAIPRVYSLAVFLETLKLLHVVGPLAHTNISSISCSGGEASLCADAAFAQDISMPPLTARQKTELRMILGPKVALANPLDYHTYIWTDTAAMAAAFAAISDRDLALSLLIIDFPDDQKCDAADWQLALDAALVARTRSACPLAVVATLPELMPEEIAQRLIKGGVLPLSGLPEAMAAIKAAAIPSLPPKPMPVLLPKPNLNSRVIEESAAKLRLATAGILVPKNAVAKDPEAAAEKAVAMGFPVVLKGQGSAHKTEAGLVQINLLNAQDVRVSAAAMATPTFLVEKMITDNIAELLVGVFCDPAHGYVLTLAAGGILTELLSDKSSLLIPASEDDVRRALSGLKIYRVLSGYRGRPAANIDAVVAVIMQVQNFVIANADTVTELEINPLICGHQTAVAVDALLKCEE